MIIIQIRVRQCIVHTFLMIEMASDERNLGYLTSSLTIESNTSSSSSPGKGDCRGQSANQPMINSIIIPSHKINLTMLGSNFASLVPRPLSFFKDTCRKMGVARRWGYKKPSIKSAYNVIPLQQAFHRWVPRVPTSPQLECRRRLSAPQERETRVYHKTCWF